MDFDKKYENIKEEYKKLKYKLPKFEELEENFDLDKLVDRNKKFILQNIRRIMMEKFGSYSQLFEALLNPTSTSRLLYHIIRKLDSTKQREIKEYCDLLIKCQFESIKLETVYQEKKEVSFLNETYKIWEELKIKILKLLESIDISSEEAKSLGENNYFS